MVEKKKRLEPKSKKRPAAPREEARGQVEAAPAVEAESVPAENPPIENLSNDNRGNEQPIASDVSSEAPVKNELTRKVERDDPGAEYAVYCHFDKTVGSFVAGVLEFPQLRAVGQTREAAMEAMVNKLTAQVDEIVDSGQLLPQPLFTKSYPESLQVSLSQTLFRRLDMLSRVERTGLEELVLQMLSTAIERRTGANRGGQQTQPQQTGGHRPHHGPNGSHGQRDRGHGGGQGQHPRQGGRRHGGGGGRMGGRNYQQTMASGEDFMEYVRNLEKGGGPGWKKR